MWLNTPARALTEMSILYKDGHTDTRTDGRTDRLIQVYPKNIRFARGGGRFFFFKAKNINAAYVFKEENDCDMKFLILLSYFQKGSTARWGHSASSKILLWVDMKQSEYIEKKNMSNSLFKPVLESCSGKGDFNAFAKTFDPCQPARIAQADMGRNYLGRCKFFSFCML